MSLLNREPIRVSDLPEPVYVPRVPSRAIAKAYEESNRDRSPSAATTQERFRAPAVAQPNKTEDPSAEVVDLLRRTNAGSGEARFEQFPTSSTELPAPATTKVWGIPFHVVDMEQTLDYLEQVIRMRKPSYAITANLNYAMLCSKHSRLAAFTEKSTLTLCDGKPVLWRSRLNAVPLPERVAGADLIFRLTERCAQKKFRVYFFGAAEGVAEKAAVALKKLYPNLIVAGVQCPAFGACNIEEIQLQLESIQLAKPDLLYVALGQPKGEYWIEDHLDQLGIPLTIQVGASFDFVAGNSVRAPKILQRLGLEWLHRTIKDPKRLAPRYWNNLVYLLKTVRNELIEKLS